jgi:hypothetical protein
MGTMQAAAFAEEVQQGNIDLDSALEWHLTANHYPPMHPLFVPSAKEAIEAVNADDPGREITMVNGQTLMAIDIVSGMHLHAFLDEQED